jgi:sodium/bile acid cotransporter 7
VWSVFCTAVATGSFQLVDGTSLGALFIINGGLYILFSLLIMFTARIPIRHWQLSREDTVAMMYCGATKTVAMGIPLINVLYAGGDSSVIGLLSLPLILYHVEQLILGAIEVLLLKIWVTRGQQKQTATPKNNNTNVRQNNVVEPQVPELREIIVR